MLLNIIFGGSYLFSKEPITTYLKKRDTELNEELVKIDGDLLASKDLDYWCNDFWDRHKVNIPCLELSKIQQNEPSEAKVTTNYFRKVHKEIIPESFNSGIRFSFRIPYSGDKAIFYHQPNPLRETELHAFVGQSSLTIQYLQDKPNLNEVRSRLEQDVKEIKQTLSLLERDITTFNESLKNKIIDQLEPRFSNLTMSRSIAKELGFPLIRRDEVVEEYIIPTVRKKVSPSTVNSVKLENQQYEDILSVIHNMVMVMERSPNTFRNMEEEEIRTLFLVLLNSIYEGQATGETFNLYGKTDILIRWNGENIFIAECKIWSGAKEFSKAIDQLLGYKPWRDTKTALLIFNRNKDFSSVLNQITDLVKAHPNFICEIPYKSETGFRFVLHDSSDETREFILTVLAFDVPT